MQLHISLMIPSGIEPPTSSMSTKRSPAELRNHNLITYIDYATPHEKST